jgi:hypothetical protein
MTAKMKSKRFRKDSRPDFELIKVNVMRWCLRVKLLQNWDRFARLLLATGERPIVEVSRKDSYWGAQPDDSDGFVGGNVMGRLLMELREQLQSNRSDALRAPVSPLAIPDFLLLGMPIGVVTERQDQPNVGVGDAVTPPPVVETVDQDVAVHLFVSYSGHAREVGNERLPLSGFIERLIQLWSQHDEFEELELTVKCRPGSEQRVVRVLRGNRSDAEESDSDEEPQLQLFPRLRHL